MKTKGKGKETDPDHAPPKFNPVQQQIKSKVTKKVLIRAVYKQQHLFMVSKYYPLPKRFLVIVVLHEEKL